MSFSRLLFLGSLPFRSHKPPPFSSIRFRRQGSSAAFDTVTDADTPNTPLQSLPTEDIRTVVGHGCPHLFYKVVNSAKKLRAHVHLNEVN
ncbi:hypothetical protein Ddye_003107, partial [Dipteronia dyeriana]